MKRIRRLQRHRVGDLARGDPHQVHAVEIEHQPVEAGAERRRRRTSGWRPVVAERAALAGIGAAHRGDQAVDVEVGLLEQLLERPERHGDRLLELVDHLVLALAVDLRPGARGRRAAAVSSARSASRGRARRRPRRARPRRSRASRRGRRRRCRAVRRGADLVHLREQPVVGGGDRVALADGVLQPLAHQVERGGELAALLDRLQDRGLLPADLLHRDLEAVLRRAGLGGALVALGRRVPRAGPGRRSWMTTARVTSALGPTRSTTIVAVATAIQPSRCQGGRAGEELGERREAQVARGASRLDEQPFLGKMRGENAVQPTSKTRHTVTLWLFLPYRALPHPLGLSKNVVA